MRRFQHSHPPGSVNNQSLAAAQANIEHGQGFAHPEDVGLDPSNATANAPVTAA